MATSTEKDDGCWEYECECRCTSRAARVSLCHDINCLGVDTCLNRRRIKRTSLYHRQIQYDCPSANQACSAIECWGYGIRTLEVVENVLWPSRGVADLPTTYPPIETGHVVDRIKTQFTGRVALQSLTLGPPLIQKCLHRRGSRRRIVLGSTTTCSCGCRRSRTCP